MKKYTQANKKMIFLGILIPIILFVLILNFTYAYLSAQTQKRNSETSTAYVKISIKDDLAISVNSQSLTANQKLLPGDVLSIAGVVENGSSKNIYCLMKLSITITKQDNSTPISEQIIFSYDGEKFVEVKKVDDAYNVTAFVVSCQNEEGTNIITKDFSFDYTLDGETFDNDYENATINYTVSAHAIQEDNITDGVVGATDILMSTM